MADSPKQKTPALSDVEKRARKAREFRHVSDEQLLRLVRHIEKELNVRRGRRWNITYAARGLDFASEREGSPEIGRREVAHPGICSCQACKEARRA